MGLKQANILEPACGIGNFFGMVEGGQGDGYQKREEEEELILSDVWCRN